MDKAGSTAGSRIGKAAGLLIMVLVLAGAPQLGAQAAEAAPLPAGGGAVTTAETPIGAADAAALAAAEAAAQQTIDAADAGEAPVALVEEAPAAFTEEEMTILAGIIYCEAGSESHEGKVAVGNVVLNRVASAKFPNTIREVVYQQGQFTPAINGQLDPVIANGGIPADCVQAAQDAVNGTKPVGDCIFFNGTTSRSEGIVIGGHRFFGAM